MPTGTAQKQKKKVHRSAWERMWRRFREAARVPGLWRAVLLFAGTNAAATVASAFFTSYTLRSLRLDEQHYVALNIASTVARFVISPLWGVAVDRRGALYSAALSIALMIPLPLVLVLSRQSFATAATFQILTGVLGAGYDTARLPVLLALAPRPKLTTALIQLYNLVNGVACFLASCLSVRAAALYGSAFDHAPVVSFALSFLLRLIVFLLWLALSLRATATAPPTASAPASVPSAASSGTATAAAATASGGSNNSSKSNNRGARSRAAPGTAAAVPGIHEVWPIASPLHCTIRPLPPPPPPPPLQSHNTRQQQQQQRKKPKPLRKPPPPQQQQHTS